MYSSKRHFPLAKNSELFKMVTNDTGNSWKSFQNIWTFLDEILKSQPLKFLEEIKSKGMKIHLVINFRKVLHTSRGCSLLWKFRKMQFHSSVEISEIQTGICYQMETILCCCEVFHLWNRPSATPKLTTRHI